VEIKAYEFIAILDQIKYCFLVHQLGSPKAQTHQQVPFIDTLPTLLIVKYFSCCY